MKWNNKQERKELTPKERQCRQKMLVYPIFVLIFVVVMYFIFIPSSSQEKVEKVNGYNVDIPLPENSNVINDKKAAYEAENILIKQGERKNLQDYAFELVGQKEENKELTLVTDNKNQTDEMAVSASVTIYKDLSKEMRSFYQPTVKEDQEKEDLKRQIKKLQEQIRKQATTENDQYKMLEESYKLAARYLNVQPAVSAMTPSPVETTKDRIVSPVSRVSDGGGGRLGTATTNNNFYSLSDKKNLHQGVIKACVFSDQILLFGENTGVQKILLRLLESIQVGDIIIPRNTLLTGVAKQGNERLTVTVDNLIHDNKIINVSLKVYDMDGLEGINTPGSQEITSTKETVSTLTENMGTSINLNGSAGQQLATDLARGVIQNATSYLGKKMKTTKVSLRGNYIIYLIADK